MNFQTNLTINNQSITVRRAKRDEIIDLRHRVLRTSLPRSEAMFPGDELPTSHHFAAFVDGDPNAIGCATFHQNTWQDQPAFQLRGMATDPAWAGKGVGTTVLRFAIESIRLASPIRVFWCNARLIAIPFYEKLGWRIASERFEIPAAGPHHRMVLGEKLSRR